MREIKFRTWSVVAQEIVCWDDLKPKFIKLLDDARYPYMQYTGLKDKNGVEIYEGDIIVFGGSETKHGIAFDESGYWLAKNIFPNDYHYYGRAMHCDDVRDIEVIGNIHENPELINKT